MTISSISDFRCHLGEGPLWDHATQSLFWVDSLGPSLYRYGWESRSTEVWHLPGTHIGSLAVSQDDEVIIAMDKGLYRFSLTSEKIELIVEPLAGVPGVRFNDGKVDPSGNFVVGAMNLDASDSVNCCMYRLSPDGHCEVLLDGFECFNGPCFSPDGANVYFTGRQTGSIEVAGYGADQPIATSRILLGNVNPDGATVDAQGHLWSAQWTDSCVLRIAPSGQIDRRLEVADQIVTSVMFGGPALDEIYLTTVGKPLHGDVPRARLAGATLVIKDSGFRGRREHRFAEAGFADDLVG